jgi:hypothetical protein
LLKDTGVPETKALTEAFSMDEVLGLKLKDAAEKEEISSDIERLIGRSRALYWKTLPTAQCGSL